MLTTIEVFLIRITFSQTTINMLINIYSSLICNLYWFNLLKYRFWRKMNYTIIFKNKNTRN